MFGNFDISTSALVAQRTRLNVISANLANRFSTHDAQGNYDPYRRRIPVFAPGSARTSEGRGVHVEKILIDQSPLRKVFVGKDHPLANEEGYMKMPNVNPAIAMVNALEATRAYEANITAVQATKSMIQSAVRILA